ncbi:IS481 family transposase [uncultured Paraglaciecola sp.]|uniref:IS481 family transposase n=1 Tax=uncultured Paraglaciecola sp. TaxID=1765024 RepID=UPI002614DF80|nr:IS481 family transposase [uncultured Paraglaciecola sp.]
MQVKLHANATTTPRIRKYIQESDKPASVLSRELGIAESTVRSWRKRDSVQDGSHTPLRLQTTMSPVQELLVVELRKLLLLSLDDLLVVTREFINPAVSRSALDRCLRRYNVSRLADLIPDTEPTPSPKSFKAYDPGYVHIDVKYLPQMPDEKRRKYLFVGIDRATRWVYMEVLPDKTAGSARSFLKRLVKSAPFKVKTTLTDNGKEFTDRFCATGQRAPTGKHLFDKECTAQGIEHRLIKPKHPQTNGMVERFNGRIADILKRTTFESSDDLSDTLQRYGLIYNQHIAQKALGHITPLDKLKEYYRSSPELFRIKPVNRPGPDSY